MKKQKLRNEHFSFFSRHCFHFPLNFCASVLLFLGFCSGFSYRVPPFFSSFLGEGSCRASLVASWFIQLLRRNELCCFRFFIGFRAFVLLFLGFCSGCSYRVPPLFFLFCCSSFLGEGREGRCQFRGPTRTAKLFFLRRERALGGFHREEEKRDMGSCLRTRSLWPLKTASSRLLDSFLPLKDAH